jgi:hypothetical protein
MANHLHKQIRDKVVTALTGLSTTSTRVYANRTTIMADDNLPGLLVVLDDERADILTMHQPHAQDRHLSLSVDCCAKATSALDDTLDQISKEVEIALASGITIGSNALPLYYTGMAFETELAGKQVGVKSLKFSIPFTAMNNAPDVLI